MATFTRMALLALGIGLAVGAPGFAQYRPGYPAGPYGGYPGGTPVFSPYLNIVGRGNPAINYYGITRPQMEFRNAIYGSWPGTPSPVEPEDQFDPALRRGTGHAVMFNNLSHYYYNNPTTGFLPSMGAGSAGARSGGRVYGYGAGVPTVGVRGSSYTPSTGGNGMPR